MRTGGRRRGKDYSIVLRRLMVRYDLAERSPFHTSQSMRTGHSFVPLKETREQKETLSLLTFLMGASRRQESSLCSLSKPKSNRLKLAACYLCGLAFRNPHNVTHLK